MLIPSGSIALRYINDSQYLFNEEHGWYVSGEPTEKLQTLLKEADRLSKDKWIFAKPNDSFISMNDTPMFDMVIPSYWNTSGTYPKSDGVGYDEDVKLEEIIQADEEYSSYISPTVLINPSGYNRDVPDDLILNYLPKMDPGYFFIGDHKVYLYPNKVTRIMKMRETDELYGLDVSEIDDLHPIYANKVSGTFESLEATLRNYEEISDEVLKIESRNCNNDTDETIGDVVHPYIPFTFISEGNETLVQTGNSSHMEHVVLHGVETTIPKTQTYINLRDEFLHVEDPFDGVIILTYNEKNSKYVVPHNVDLSPITWDSTSRILSIVSGSPDPLSSQIFMPLSRVNNTDCTIPITINVRDANGVPVSGITIYPHEIYRVTDTEGNNLIYTVSDTLVSGVQVTKFSNMPTAKHVVLNDNRAIGYTHKSQTELYVERAPYITPSGITDEYGSAYLEIKVEPYYEPVSTLRFTYDITSSGGSLSGDTLIELEVERGSIMANLETNYEGEYVEESYIPKLRTHSILHSLDYENIEVSGWIYGNQARVYAKTNWLDTKDSYDVVDIAPISEMSTIITSDISGEYVVEYSEVIPTCL